LATAACSTRSTPAGVDVVLYGRIFFLVVWRGRTKTRSTESPTPNPMAMRIPVNRVPRSVAAQSERGYSGHIWASPKALRGMQNTSLNRRLATQNCRKPSKSRALDICQERAYLWSIPRQSFFRLTGRCQ
jgi:hypothetical protein